jgi:hypothetical protein
LNKKSHIIRETCEGWLLALGLVCKVHPNDQSLILTENQKGTTGLENKS